MYESPGSFYGIACPALVHVLQTKSRRCLKQPHVNCIGLWQHLSLTVAADSHCHVTGKDIQQEHLGTCKGTFDAYSKQDRQLISVSSQVSREGVYFSQYWDDSFFMNGEQQVW